MLPAQWSREGLTLQGRVMARESSQEQRSGSGAHDRVHWSFSHFATDRQAAVSHGDASLALRSTSQPTGSSE